VTARRLVLLASGALLLGGCVEVGSPGTGGLACRSGDDGGPAGGVVLMSQAVDTASWVPCLDAVPVGWHLSEVEIRDGSGRFWLDSDRDGARAIGVALTGSCDVREATEIPSDRDGMRRYERVARISPDYVGTRSYVFDGGCLTTRFRLTGHDRAEPLGVATEVIDVMARADVEAAVRESTDGRLQLDAGDGAP
jgi:hypothetical protein